MYAHKASSWCRSWRDPWFHWASLHCIRFAGRWLRTYAAGRGDERWKPGHALNSSGCFCCSSAAPRALLLDWTRTMYGETDCCAIDELGIELSLESGWPFRKLPFWEIAQQPLCADFRHRYVSLSVLLREFLYQDQNPAIAVRRLRRCVSPSASLAKSRFSRSSSLGDIAKDLLLLVLVQYGHRWMCRWQLQADFHRPHKVLVDGIAADPANKYQALSCHCMTQGLMTIINGRNDF